MISWNLWPVQPPFEQWVTKAKDAGAELIFSLYGWAQPAAPNRAISL